MRAAPNLAVERYRIKHGERATSRYDGNNGCFRITMRGGRTLFCIVSDGGAMPDGLRRLEGWEHVSVSVLGHPAEQPTWMEMHAVKELFWSDDECVVQYHPPKVDYVNVHDGVLHLWRHVEAEIPRPPKELV